ncbi:MAG: hypothetical protein CMN73_11660 [Sphingomonas sp.]|nr:hypothetical protein [Sphingomonas sp.]|tara:strand:+ start:292 stop:1044 length:753 start_codon:yes stop_codon:yes gene_type:complete
MTGFIGDWLAIQRRYIPRRGNGNPWVEGLRKQGYHIEPNAFSTVQVAAMRAAVPNLETLRDSPDETGTRLLHDARNLPEFGTFFEDIRIAAAVREIIGAEATMLRSTVQLRYQLGRTGSFDQFFHFDSWRHRIKCFLYLSDVGPQNAPLIYAPTTHRRPFRLARDLEIRRHTATQDNSYLADLESQFVGALFPHQAQRMFHRLAIRPVELTGSAGTLILFDARGFHRSKPLEAGCRTILSSYWIKQGEHI